MELQSFWKPAIYLYSLAQHKLALCCEFMGYTYQALTMWDQAGIQLCVGESNMSEGNIGKSQIKCYDTHYFMLLVLSDL